MSRINLSAVTVALVLLTCVGAQAGGSVSKPVEEAVGVIGEQCPADSSIRAAFQEKIKDILYNRPGQKNVAMSLKSWDGKERTWALYDVKFSLGTSGDREGVYMAPEVALHELTQVFKTATIVEVFDKHLGRNGAGWCRVNFQQSDFAGSPPLTRFSVVLGPPVE